jgi:menaquinone-dependent protoporphyrinogen oxidase
MEERTETGIHTMSKVLILYASQKGSTAEVAKFLAETLKQAGHQAVVENVEHFTGDIHAYDAIILGSGIYKGLWLHPLITTVNRLKSQFGLKPVWGFALCIRVLEPAGEDYARQFYLPKNLLNNLNLQEYHFFAGKLQNLSISDKNTLHERYDGEYAQHEGDYRNWDEIRAWGRRIATKLQSVKVK